MVYEYAIDPALVLAWAKDIRDYRKFVDSFGLGTTRIRSSAPRFNKWRSAVFRMLPDPCDETYGNRVAELVQAIGESAEVYRTTTFPKSRPWIDAVKIYDANIPFNYVLVDKKTGGEPPHFYTGDDIYHHPQRFWNHRNQKPVTRTAANMASEVGNMLRLSRHIVFVDPYFREQTSKREPIEAFLDHTFSNRVEPGVDSIAILYSSHVKNLPKSSYIAQDLRNRWRGKWPSGFSVRLRALREKPDGEQIHNRYVLTELGGVSFGIGLDQGEATQTDDMMLLEAELHRKRWDQYFNCAAFEIDQEEILEF